MTQAKMRFLKKVKTKIQMTKSNEGFSHPVNKLSYQWGIGYADITSL